MRLHAFLPAVALAIATTLPVSALAQKPDADRTAAEQLLVEATFPGPAEGTLIQRVRDTAAGTLCYLYVPANLPIVRDEKGALIHGANSIGSISCVAAPLKR